MNIIFPILHNTDLCHAAQEFLIQLHVLSKNRDEDWQALMRERGLSPQPQPPERAWFLLPYSQHKPVQPPGDPLESLFNQVKKSSIATALFVYE